MSKLSKMPGNVFLALAQALWARGEDGEVVARDMATAFRVIAEQGVGKGQDLEEYTRLRNE